MINGFRNQTLTLGISAIFFFLGDLKMHHQNVIYKVDTFCANQISSILKVISFKI
jgi:hypothetical protein